MKPRNRRLRNLLPRIGLLIASPFVVLVFAELLLHLTPSSIPYLHFAKPALYRADPELIYSFRPGVSGHNALGMRSRKIGAKRGRVRIVAIGDSYTYGHGVPASDAYPQQLEHILNASQRGRRFEVINAGVPGYNFDQAYTLLTRRLLELEPDLVVIAFEPKDLGGGSVLYSLDEGSLVPVPAWHNWIFLQLSLRTRVPEPLRRTRLYEFAVSHLTGSDPFGVLPSRNPDELNAWQIDKILKMTEELIALSEARGFALLIVNYPDKTAIDHGGDYRHGTYFKLPVNVLGVNANAHMARLRAGLASSGAHFVDALDAFLTLDWTPNEYAGLYLGDDPHMSRAGNGLLAEILAEYILREVITSSATASGARP